MCIVTNKLRSRDAALRDPKQLAEPRSHKGLNKWAEISHRLLRHRKKIWQRFRSPGSLQRFAAVLSALHNLFYVPATKRTVIFSRLNALA